jgi:heptosyltransferase-3
MKILVVKRDKLGDLLLTTPMLAHLKKSQPEAEIHLLANDYNAWVVAGNSDVDRTWVYRRVRQGGRVRIGAALMGLRQSLQLRAERFDWVLVANGEESPRAIRRAISVGAVRSVAYVNDPLRYPRLTDPLRMDSNVRAMHEMDRLLALLGPLGIAPPATPQWPRYVLPQEAANFAHVWLAERNLTAGSYIVLGLGARRPKKQPTTTQVLAWSAHFKQAWGLDTVFMWTPGASNDPLYPGDDAVAQPVLDARVPYLQPFRGPIREALGLVWGAGTSLFPDSGLMHFAAASPGGVLGFFAETDVSPNPRQWGPRGPRVDYLEADQSVAELEDATVYTRVARLLAAAA